MVTIAKRARSLDLDPGAARALARGMSEGMNQVNLIGNLGAAPELRQTTAGPVLKLSLATTVVYFDKEHQKKTITEWHRVSVWGRRGEALAKILTKGSCVAVSGRLHTSSYEKDGQKRYSTEVVAENVILVGSRPSATDEAPAPYTNGAPRMPHPEATTEGLPF